MRHTCFGVRPRGGAETVIDRVTGLLFHEQSSAAIQQAVREFELIEDSFEPAVIRANAMRFSTERFRDEFTRYVHARWHEHKRNVAVPEAMMASVPSAPGYRQTDQEYEGAMT